MKIIRCPSLADKILDPIYLFTIAMVLSAVVVVKAEVQSIGNTSQKPNIIYILSDDLGYGDLGCYGATHVKTPNLDQLAAEGIRFTDAHATASVCTPTRFALLTGKYAWRQEGTGIARGDAPLLIKPGTMTIPSLLKSAGYATGIVGKWHLGLGEEKTDFNKPIRPGPLELGFDYAFFIPATGDRVPCVFVENHDVVNYDPADPIQVSYGKEKIGNEPTGMDEGVKLKMKGDKRHSQTVINGIPRIGYMSGGRKAHWVDEDIADNITAKASSFIEKNAKGPFFLFLSTHDIHEPMVPHKRFAGTSRCGSRGDVIQQLDWTVGEVMKTLDRLNLRENTLVIFTSDNGGAIKSTYDDGTNELHGLQKPNGALRGKKAWLYEGAHRVPFIARWPGKIEAGQESSALLAQVDMLHTFASLTGVPLPNDAGLDSLNVLPLLLGKSSGQNSREELVLQGNSAFPLALRQNDWILLETGPNPQRVDYELYDLNTDLAQKEDLAARETKRLNQMKSRLQQIRSQGRTRLVD
jgi:arylsulfatase A-like enzyme